MQQPPVSDVPGWWDWLVTGLLSVLLAVALLVVARLVYLGVTRPSRWSRISSEPLGERVPVTRDEELQSALDAGLRAVSSGAPTDGVIRCWVALEEVAARAGVPREPAETSTEFTVRVLGARDVPADDLQLLAALYREARFSDHGLGEPARAQAEAALTRLRRSLSRAR